MSQPWMPFYVADYLSDTLHLNAEESGVYMLMMMIAWRRNDASLPDDMAWLKRSLSACVTDMHGNRFNRLVPKILEEFWSKKDGKWVQKRLLNEKEKAVNFSRNQREKIEKRWAKTIKSNKLADTVAIPEHSDPVIPARASLQSQHNTKIRDTDVSLVNATVDLCEIDEKKKALREWLQILGEEWNELAEAYRLPTIEEIKPSSTRERHALARLREMDLPREIPELMARIRNSPYLRGEVNGFRCTFDWVIKDSNFQKIMEGNYENRQKARH